ncbi:MAG: 1-aminocyclopropane-1-carboxylate deaminase [Helicobacteraceae bacterium]|nr:1-aminocyclopropane-1-carboxylate deaminase [Helicobacteraceae bacterium]
METFEFRGRTYHIKHDELIDLELSGNKFRKLYTLIQTPSSKYKKIISYGGSQSNAMYSISALCKRKGWSFEYYTKTLSSEVEKSTHSNFALSIKNGMLVKEVKHNEYDQTIQKLLEKKFDAETFLVKQGGAQKEAQYGINNLALEIRKQFKNENINIITPSGTGTTAFYLAKELSEHKIYTTACVGQNEYLKDQIELLGELPKNLTLLQSSKKYHFASLYKEFIELFLEFKKAGIEFDLLYAMKMWTTLIENIDSVKGDILYVHSGGLVGNESMLERYKYKGFYSE